MSSQALYVSIPLYHIFKPIYPYIQLDKGNDEASKSLVARHQHPKTAFVTHNDLIDDFTRTKHFLSATHYNRVCVSGEYYRQVWL